MAELKTYSIRDLALATTLVTLKFKIINITYQIEGMKNYPVGYFEFEDTDLLQKTIRAYNDGDLAVEPREFITNMRTLKSHVTGYYKGPNTNFDKLKKEQTKQNTAE